MVKIKLSRGLFSIVDDEFEWLSKRGKWTAKTNSSGNFYAQRRINRKNGHEYIHRMVVDAPKGKQVDHINGDTLDNRKCNLRICTNKQNSHNQKKAKGLYSSIYKGVSRRKGSIKWLAQIQTSGYRKTKTCNTEIEAAIWYNKFAKEIFGDFARLNIIPKVVESD